MHWDTPSENSGPQFNSYQFNVMCHVKQVHETHFPGVKSLHKNVSKIL